MKNVLIVDDNPVVRRHLRGLLEHDACLVAEANDGVEGLQQAIDKAWDVIFLDLQMPRMGGLDVLRELQGRGLKVPVVLITSSESSAEIVSAFKLGAKEYLLKPFREPQVRHAMQQVAGLDYTTIHRTGSDVALLDPDEGLAMTVRELCAASDKVEQAETKQGLGDCLSSKHQLVLVGSFGEKSEAEEAEALGDLVSQRDPDAVLVRLLSAGQALPDVTVFHAAVRRDDEAGLKEVFRALRAGAAVSSGRRMRSLRYSGPPQLVHLYWWTLLRSLRMGLRRQFVAGGSAVIIDLSLAPDDAQARAELQQTLSDEAEGEMVRLQFTSGVGPAPATRPPAPATPAPQTLSAPKSAVTSVPPAPATVAPSVVATREVPVQALLGGPTKAAPLSTPPPAPAAAGGDAPLIIPGFEIGPLLGEGGMSRVFRATQKSLRRQVCVKVMRREFVQEPSLADRFQDEGIALAALRHPNIVSVLDVGRTDDGQLFMLMEYVDGGDLRALLQRVEKLSIEQCVTLGTQLLSGLAEAHGSGIIHRDIKPSNVLTTKLKDGSLLMKLVDFGIAKLMEGVRVSGASTRMGTVVGTPGYMAPEQLLGMEVTPATDLYAVGVILFEMLTGRRAFVARDEFELAQLTMLTPVPHLREILDVPVPDDLDALINQLLAKNPRDRPQSAAEVRTRLLAISNLKAA